MSLLKLKQQIKSDLFRYYGENRIKTFFKALFLIPGFRFSFVLRFCAYFKNKNIFIRTIFFFSKIILIHYRYKYGFDISENTKIGNGFCLGHFGGVVINPAATIGDNVSVGQGVLIGKNHRGDKAGVPTIEDGVFLAAHSIVIGNIIIGKNSLIGPGTYVNFNVPDNSIVIGNPGQIVSDKGVFGGYDAKYYYE